jgi:uncharacterized membrane protein YedE/YeeE
MVGVSAAPVVRDFRTTDEPPCAHPETFFWPFFLIGGAMFGSITCMTCGKKLPGQDKLLVDGVLHEYR